MLTDVLSYFELMKDQIKKLLVKQVIPDFPGTGCDLRGPCSRRDGIVAIQTGSLLNDNSYCTHV